jgi:peptidoglycan/LPS O-acetylase OafA/YrhL
MVDKPMSRVQAFDLLRLLAVLGVVLFHYGFRGPDVDGVAQAAFPALGSFARYGFLGVPIFFIISGFVIAYSSEGRTAYQFAVARFARIYPTFLLCMTVTFLAVLAFGKPHFHTSFVQWLANLFIAAPAFRQPYIDAAYWSLVIEVLFYGWVAILIVIGLFPRRVDFIVTVWLAVSLLNEMTIDHPLICKVLLADYSGFFATGLLIHEFFKGRRDAVLQWLLAASAATAVYQAIHNVEWLRDASTNEFNDWIVGTICLASIVVILAATRIRRVPLPAAVVAAAGGITYPLYLLHQQLGYVTVASLSSVPGVLLVLTVLTGIVVLSWVVWRYFETSAQRLTKEAFGKMADWATRHWGPGLARG